jgi:hypothetical protein
MKAGFIVATLVMFKIVPQGVATVSRALSA